MLALPIWLHETLAISGVVLAGTWLVLRLAQIGRPRQVGCARCPSGAATPMPNTRGVRSKQLRVLR